VLVLVALPTGVGELEPPGPTELVVVLDGAGVECFFEEVRDFVAVDLVVRSPMATPATSNRMTLIVSQPLDLDGLEAC
jgi:hypothetical protein